MFKKIIAILVFIMMTISLCSIFPQAETNGAPKTLPAVREWVGGSGKFYITDKTSIALESENTLTGAKKEIIKGYFKEICGVDIAFVGEAKDGDIALSVIDDKKLGGEGYIAEIGDKIEIKANGETGLFYGIISILQSVKADGFIPKGVITDYPEYEIRSGMIDAARAYIPLDYLTEIAKYFAWFKLNEIHVHINDRGSDGIGYFRLESDVPNLTSEEHYTKEEYRNFQKELINYGVNVVTEIDTPAHSLCFKRAVPQLMFDEGHLDIRKTETIDFVKALWDEYITGEDPVFVGKTVHFGTDEFPEGYNEEMRAYTDAIMKHIQSRGYETRFWGSFGGKGFNGETEVSGNSQCNFWAVELSDYKVLFDMGYDIINSVGPVLYCVPGGNYGFADYYDLKRLYTTWQVNYMGYGAGDAVDPESEQLKGASFSLWNDLWGQNLGWSVFDIFDRVRYEVALISEKAWCGSQTDDIGAEDFLSRFELFTEKAPLTNPSRFVNLPIEDKIPEGVSSIGYPYVFEADIKLDALGMNILSGRDGRLFVDGNGKVCYSRGKYTFSFGTKFKKGEEHSIKLYSDSARTLLIVDGKYFYDPVNEINKAGDKSFSFVLPIENIGSEKVSVENIKITRPDFKPDDFLANANLALNKKVTVSGLEVPYAYDETLAVDGKLTTRLSFARDKDEQWMVVDLGEIYNVGRINVSFFERVSDYELYASEDGENYKKVAEKHGLPEGVRGESDEISIEPTGARYIKYVQLKRWYCADYNTYYSGGISEFEVYPAEKDDKALLEKAESIDDENVKKALKAVEKYKKLERKYALHLDSLYKDLENAIADFESKNSESSEVSEEKKESGSNTTAYIIAGSTALAICASLIAVKKKKKKEK